MLVGGNQDRRQHDVGRFGLTANRVQLSPSGAAAHRHMIDRMPGLAKHGIKGVHRQAAAGIGVRQVEDARAAFRQGDQVIPIPHFGDGGCGDPLRHPAVRWGADHRLHGRGIDPGAVMETRAGLGQQHAAHRPIQMLLRQPPTLHGLHNRLDHRFGAGRLQQQVGTGQQGEKARLRHRIPLGNRTHIQCVCDDQPVEVHPPAQEVSNDVRGEGGRSGLGPVDRRDGNVANQHAIHPRANRLLKRRKFHRGEPRGIPGNRRHAEMGVHLGVTMPGKVFSGGLQTRTARPFDPSGGDSRHPFGISAEGTDVDDRIGRIGVDVENRPQRHVNSYGPRLYPRQCARRTGEFLAVSGAEGHGRRDVGAAGSKPHRRTRLQVGDDEQRNIGSFLSRIQFGRQCCGSPGGNDQAADALLPHPAQHALRL